MQAQKKPMYKAIALCEAGFEDVARLEIKEILGVNSEVNQFFVSFEVDNVEKLALLCYQSQSLRRVLVFLCEGKITGPPGIIYSKLAASGLVPWIADSKTTISVECERFGEHNFKSSEIEQDAGAVAIEKIKSELGFTPSVKISDPDVKIFISISGGNFVVGIDFTGFDLSQREYKIFTHSASIKGTLGYCILRYAGYGKSTKLLSYFSKSGVIEIEAALFASGRPANYYRKDKFAFWKLDEFKNLNPKNFFSKIDGKIKDSAGAITGIDPELRHVMAGKKNAKIAGVDKLINFTRIDADWLGLKLKENYFDMLICHASSYELSKLSELLSQSKAIMKKEGKFVLLAAKKDACMESKQHGLTCSDEKEIRRGSSSLFLHILVKK